MNNKIDLKNDNRFVAVIENMTESKFDKYSKKELLDLCKILNITSKLPMIKKELISMIVEKNAKKNDLKKEDVSNDKQYSYNFVDLFCGIGGFHNALNNINAKCVFASDIDENCRKIYEKNYKLKPEGDITKIDISKIPSFDILCGGFPCQPFSKAGFQKGFDDDRGNLFFNICDIVKYHKPSYLILENVRNLSTHDEGNTWKVIYENIDKLGYNTYSSPVILNALHFNIPQNRERVIIMCKRKDLGDLPILPDIPKNPKHNLTKEIKDYIFEEEREENKKYLINAKLKDTEKIWDNFIQIMIKNNVSIPKFPIWTDWWDNDIKEGDIFYKKYTSWIDKNREFYKCNSKYLKEWIETSRQNKNWTGALRKFEWQAGDMINDDGMKKVLWSARGSGIRVKRLNYIPTLVAMSMIPVYGPESRKLSPKELLRLQSFPSSFEYDEKKIYKQVGNAVNVKMIEQCARFLIHNESLF
jgi:DNA (cytosine-5)-methyltransferase 1